MLTEMQLNTALRVLGDLISDQDATYDLVIIGGGALLLTGLVNRQATEDLVVVARIVDGVWVSARPLPPELKSAVHDVADALDIATNWLNSGPADIMDFGLPEGFADRAEVRTYGGLTARFAGRQDQIALKLDAAADKWPDKSKHLRDLRLLAPTSEHLTIARKWCRNHRDQARNWQLDEVIFHLTFEAHDDWR
jgi:hypothetical protein